MPAGVFMSAMWRSPPTPMWTTSCQPIGNSFFQRRCHSVSGSHQRSQLLTPLCDQCQTRLCPHLGMSWALHDGQTPLASGPASTRSPFEIAYLKVRQLLLFQSNYLTYLIFLKPSFSSEANKYSNINALRCLDKTLPLWANKSMIIAYSSTRADHQKIDAQANAITVENPGQLLPDRISGLKRERPDQQEQIGA